MTAEACPSGTCSDAREQCFGISAERCVSSAPTNAPTVVGPQPTTSPSVSSVPTPASASPTKKGVNTYFCGADYDDATASCSEATACPTGSGCPNGMNCFTGISCAPLLPPTTAPPTTFWNQLVGDDTTPPPVHLIQKYCGVDLQDATSLCANKIPCHDGNTLVCPSGETCFEIAGKCGDTVAPTPAATLPPSLPIPASSPQSPTPEGEAFDLNRDRCGDDYEDAVMNCRDRLACTLGATDDCPSGQNCYPVVICETTPPPSPVSMNETTAKPVWEWDLNALQTTSGTHTMTASLKSIALVGSISLVFLF